MNTRALRVLEFEKIREQLSLFAQSDAGKALCLKLIPAGDRTEVEERLAETEEAVVILTYHGANPISSFRDVTEWLSLAEKGSTLSPRALLDIAEVLRVSAAVRASLVTERENTPRITGEASLLQPLKTLQQDISDAILSEDEISDRASPELADIRRRIRQTNDRVRDRLNQMAHGTAFAKYLMEPIITMRSGRYVLPVKQEYRQAVPGLVHDQSATGATLYIEPMAVVEMGNELREWELKEKKEIERILAALSAQAGDSAALIRGNLNVLSHLDFVFARGALARSMDAVSPRLNGEGRIRLLRARHPLIPADRVVPLTLWLGDDFTTLVITGPNTGGKTVTLKTVGLFALMAQAGLQVPAALGTELPVFREVWADIGDEQSIEQSLSTFSSHMKNIVEILRDVKENDLALFDELGAGTDPTEGAALARAILSSLTERGIRTAATTHYSELKTYALVTQGVENASVEFDVATLRPTYRLSIGVPGKSNAFEISRRLGLSESMIEEARKLLNHDDIRFEDVIANAEYHRQVAEKEQKLAEEARQETVAMRNEAEKLYREVSALRQNAEKQARADARRIVEKARQESEQIISEMKKLKKNAGDASQLRRKLENSLDEYAEGLSPAESALSDAPPKSLNVGDTVRVLTLNIDGTVLAPPDSQGSVALQCGAMKMKASLDQLRLLKAASAAPKPQSTVHASFGGASATVPLSVDLRGMNLDEALDRIDSYLDDAYLAGFHEVTLVHGKGTGILRSGIARHLKKHAHVRSSRLGVYGEGEDGVTIVTLE